jgi:hypothetical protein
MRLNPKGSDQGDGGEGRDLEIGKSSDRKLYWIRGNVEREWEDARECRIRMSMKRGIQKLCKRRRSSLFESQSE